MLTDSIVPGAGAFEIAVHAALVKHKETVKGRARLGNVLLKIFKFLHLIIAVCHRL